MHSVAGTSWSVAVGEVEEGTVVSARQVVESRTSSGGVVLVGGGIVLVGGGVAI